MDLVFYHLSGSDFKPLQIPLKDFASYSKRNSLSELSPITQKEDEKDTCN